MNDYTKRLFRRKVPTSVVTTLVLLVGWILKFLEIT